VTIRKCDKWCGEYVEDGVAYELHSFRHEFREGMAIVGTSILAVAVTIVVLGSTGHL
jgi:hypothetical protein